jgi:hypothetical protein
VSFELELGESFRKGSEDFQLDRWGSREEAVEFAIRKHKESAVTDAGGGRGPWLPENERHFREEVTSPLNFERPSLAFDFDLALDDDEELVSDLALSKQNVAGRNVDLIG